MDNDTGQKVLLELQTIREDMSTMKLAMMGDPSMKIDGLHQHVDEIKTKVCTLENDVRSLKTDRIKIIAWVSGLAAGVGAVGSKAIEWVKS